MSIKSVLPSNHLILCQPLLLLPSIFPSIRVFFNESVLCIRWPKYWSFSFSISPSSEYSGLISFRIDWFDLFAVQGILKRLLQHHSLKASILRRSAFLMVQISHLYMTTGKTTALTIWSFISKVMSASGGEIKMLELGETGVRDHFVSHIIYVIFINIPLFIFQYIISAPPVCHALYRTLGTQRRPGQKSPLPLVAQ